MYHHSWTSPSSTHHPLSLQCHAPVSPAQRLHARRRLAAQPLKLPAEDEGLNLRQGGASSGCVYICFEL